MSVPVLRSAPRPVSDQLLQQLRCVAHAAQGGPVTAIEVESLLHHMPDLLDELQERRTAMASSNVLTFPMVDAGDVSA